ncbi:MAG: hypothetical protein NW226_02805 [Microscillaceae bacterium]|nr:hypothetical protein [Microscillaceae bacterium]
MDQAEKKYIYYVVVVHGIGEQKLNSTVTPVINRFAQVLSRANYPSLSDKDIKDLVSLGMVTSQTGHPRKAGDYLTFSQEQPWAEFENIRPDGNMTDKFDAKPSTSGENIRFTEMYWADILNENFEISGQPVDTWAETLIARLENRKMMHERWVLMLLRQLHATLLLLYKLLILQAPGIRRLIFDRFLGDVQIYGENPWVRGQAVGRFHNLLEKIESYHKKRNPEAESKYIIISHSLGTVLSMDALFYAHCKKAIYMRELRDKLPNLPFEAFYEEYKGELPLASKSHEINGHGWVDHVVALVTLGSPIDKFLTLWPDNYLYLCGMEAGDDCVIDQYFQHRKVKIKHFNYCDEQDPVGHKLVMLREQPLYDFVFENADEIIFNRYALPGFAHNFYWNDADLFEVIFKNTINPDFEGKMSRTKGSEEGFKKSTVKYWKSIFNSYLLFPSISIPITSFLFLWGWHTSDREAFEFSFILIFMLMGVSYVFRRMTSLAIWWRQIFRLKAFENDKYHHKSSSDMFRLMAGLVLLVLVLMCIFYVSGNIQCVDSLEDYYYEIYYLQSIFGISFLVLAIQYFNKIDRVAIFLRRLWTVSEVKTLMWFLALVAVCYYLGRSEWFAQYCLLPQSFYWDSISIILLNTTLTWIYAVVYFYDVSRIIKNLDFH